MLAQIEAWGKLEEKEIRSFAQNIEREIKDADEKLHKLVNVFRDEILEQKIYLKNREELIKIKTELMQMKRDVGAKGCILERTIERMCETCSQRRQACFFIGEESFIGKNWNEPLFEG